MDITLKEQLKNIKRASYTLSNSTNEERNDALKLIKEELLSNIPSILEANQRDLKKMDASDPLLDRLMLNEERVKNICKELDIVISREDPLGRILENSEGPSGIQLQRISVPIGVIGIIYESRPNVTIDVTALCLKSGNAVMLRGSTSAYESNKALCTLIHRALTKSRISSETVQLLSPDKSIAEEMMKADEYLDLIIPRGGKSLIQKVRETSSIPTIETGASVVHSFVDESAEIEMACDIIINEKTRRPSVCNAVDTVLIHEKIAASLLPKLAMMMKDSQILLHTEKESQKLLKDLYPSSLLKEDANAHYDHEFLDLEMNIHIVASLDEALDHIRKHSLKHSESIITEDESNAERFLREVDSACVYVNTSTTFSDGAEFGLGTEIGISTQKLHARGPMGLRELTSYKWLIRSHGKIRNP